LVEALSEVFAELRVYTETYTCRLTFIQCDAAIQIITSYEEMDGEEIPPKVSLFPVAELIFGQFLTG
jgi:hypothetical protein